MKLRMEVSLYPLSNDFLPPIEDFISRINQHEGITVWTNDLSTQIFGDYDRVMEVYNSEMKRSFESKDKMVFIVKFLSPGS